MRSWRYWRNLLLLALPALALSLAAGTGWFIRQGALGYVHPPRRVRLEEQNPGRFDIAYQDQKLMTIDGLELAAWYTEPENGALILVAHGHGDARSAEMHALYARHGFGALSWDFRAHGQSEGEFTTLGFQEALDVEAALDFALGQPGVTRVGAWGGSMGAAATILAAARRPEIEAVVADSAFTALEEELPLAVSVAWMRPLVRFFAEQETGLSMDLLRPIDQVARISPRPILFIQGAADTAVPADSAERLFQQAGEPRFLWLEPGIGHMGVYASQPSEYERRVIAFFDAALLSAAD